MRYVNNKEDFLNWLIEVVFMTSVTELARSDALLSFEDDILPEFETHCPREFPGLVYLQYFDATNQKFKIEFISKNNVAQWATNMQLIPAP